MTWGTYGQQKTRAVLIKGYCTVTLGKNGHQRINKYKKMGRQRNQIGQASVGSPGLDAGFLLQNLSAPATRSIAASPHVPLFLQEATTPFWGDSEG